MTFKNTFCSSPWFHMRITNSGDYEYCRWVVQDSDIKKNISQVHPITWFQKDMAGIRQAMLDGQRLDHCGPCYNMESHGKVSGRQKQLLKTGVVLPDFEKTMHSSPWIDAWRHAQSHQGEIDLCVQDWQIDLGNFCNSACLFCYPGSSSRLATEYVRLGLISQVPPRPWCDDPVLLERFLDALRQSPDVKYLHFIGGETLITPAFRTIMEALIASGLNERLTLGFTTNLTIMPRDIVDLLEKFQQINLGMSVECLDRVNDYIRYGGEITKTVEIMDTWIDIAKRRDWLVQIRSTPTILSVGRLSTIYDYAWDHGVAVESCNFIQDPALMRPSVLPRPHRAQARDRIQSWIDSRSMAIDATQVINTRNPNHVHQQLLQDAQSYVRYLDDEPDQDHLLPDLVRYLKIMDHSRGNSVLDYLPEYEELFRSVGY